MLDTGSETKLHVIDVATSQRCGASMPEVNPESHVNRTSVAVV